MRFTLLLKDIATKTLVSGDKSMRITLETLHPRDIPQLAQLTQEVDIEVDFIDLKGGE